MGDVKYASRKRTDEGCPAPEKLKPRRAVADEALISGFAGQRTLGQVRGGRPIVVAVEKVPNVQVFLFLRFSYSSFFSCDPHYSFQLLPSLQLA